MTRIEFGVKLNVLAYLLDDENFERCKDVVEEIAVGVNELYDELENGDDRK